MGLVVAGVSFATMFLTRSLLRDIHRQGFEKQFRGRISFFQQLQTERLESIAGRARDFAQTVRLRALMRRYGESRQETNDLVEVIEKLYLTAKDQMREVLDSENNSEQNLTFLRFLDDQGKVIIPNSNIDAGLSQVTNQTVLNNRLQSLPGLLAHGEGARVGFLNIPDNQGISQVTRLIATPIYDRQNEETLGALILGFPLWERERVNPNPGDSEKVELGIWLENSLSAPYLQDPFRDDAAKALLHYFRQVDKNQKEFSTELNREPFWIFLAKLVVDDCFPPAYQVCFFSLAEMRSQQRRLFWNIMSINGAGLTIALLISWGLAHGLSVPIRELVAGTIAIKKGDFSTKVPIRSQDELGHLAEAFNEMSSDLALKEKYRNVLNMVTDREVANQLVNGQVALGGELRKVSVLFCDIRGFTQLSCNLNPTQVIEMLNEHMTLLTQVVYDHQGVVDKFVGDLVMAIFGAPKSYGNDPNHAVQCAIQMIEKRQRLNLSSQYKIKVGIGISTGMVVAGCMGSKDRLNYTVLGDRVNLASRLCSRAGPMEVIIDQSTLDELHVKDEVHTLPPMVLKGYSDPVPAFKVLIKETSTIQTI